MMHWGNFGGGMGHGGVMGYGFGFGWIFMILIWVLIILGIIYLVKYIARSSGSERRLEDRETAEDIVRKLYASGEITKEEFNERMSVLKSKR